MNATESEILAINILKPHPSILKTMLTPSGDLDINKLYLFYNELTRKLEFSKNKRKGNFEDINIIKENKSGT